MLTLSGSGNTTLLPLLAGLEKADSGSIRSGDRVVTGHGRFVSPQKREIAVVF